MIRSSFKYGVTVGVLLAVSSAGCLLRLRRIIARSNPVLSKTKKWKPATVRTRTNRSLAQIPMGTGLPFRRASR